MKTRSIFKFFFGTAGLALFNSCDSFFEPSDMYGSPWVEYEVKGHVADENGQPVEGAVVDVIEVRNGHNQIEQVQEGYSLYISAQTDKDGNYESVKEEVYAPKHIRLQCTDPSGKYETMTQWVDSEQTKKSDGWYQGKYTYKADFMLKKIEK